MKTSGVAPAKDSLTHVPESLKSSARQDLNLRPLRPELYSVRITQVHRRLSKCFQTLYFQAFAPA